MNSIRDRLQAIAMLRSIAVAVALTVLVSACSPAFVLDQKGLVAVADAAAPATTMPAAVAEQLVAQVPQVGDVVSSPFVIQGVSTAAAVGFLLTAGGDIPLAEGIIDVVDGEFTSTVEFTNTCCIEMRLEVFHLDAGRMALTIPLTYRES